jgi:hypothetical protein
MRALPHTYRNVTAEDETLITFHVIGEAGGTWHLFRKNENWIPIRDKLTSAHSEVSIPQEIAWKIFSKGVDKTFAEHHMTIRGDIELGRKILDMLSVMA